MPARGHSQGGRGIRTADIARPVGGGALGHGEHLQLDAALGSARFEVPIAVPSARDLAPSLLLRYASGGANGLFGAGFALELPAISRRTSTGIPRYDGGDQFVTEAGDVLVAERGARAERDADLARHEGKTVARYLRRSERDFDRICHVVDVLDGTSFWEVTDSRGVTRTFGRSASARIADPAAPGRIFRWMIEEARDARGDVVTYAYEADDLADAASLYCKSIRYGNFEVDGTDEQFCFTIDFLYTDVRTELRPDPISSFRSGFEYKILRLCKTIDIYHHFPHDLGEAPLLVGRNTFAYDTSGPLALLVEIGRQGLRHDASGGVETADAPPIALRYTPWSPATARFQPLRSEDWPSILGPIDNRRLGFVDLYGDGIPGLLQRSADGAPAYFWRSGGDGHFSAPHPVHGGPVEGLGDGYGTALLDLTGLGRLDEVLLAPDRAGCYANRPGADWAPFVPFQAVPTELNSPTGRFVDLTGAGRPDFIDTCVSTWRVSESLGREGYAPARTVRPPPGIDSYASDDEGVFVGFADVFGDGLSHLVRVASGSARVWPSLGYGSFAQPREIEGCPTFPGTVTRDDILFGPFTGTGRSDLAIVCDDRVEIHQNLGGERFVPLCTVPLPGAFSRLSAFVATDVLGRTTQQLVVSSIFEVPAHAILDLTDGTPPFLLETIDNNMGLVDTIAYRSSVDYMLADRAAGRPWVTPLPLPVQVVSEIKRADLISKTTEVRSVQYANGFFDPIDRQFAGFAYVQVQNSRTSDGDLWHYPSASRREGADGAGGTGALLTKTWYHVGDLDGSKALRDALRRDAFGIGAGDLLLPDTSLGPCISEASGDAPAVALRALAGWKIREEIFAVDERGITATVPIRVDQAAAGVTLVQAPDGRTAAVVLPVERETSRTIYEGDESDPRTEHRLNVSFDEFGHVLRTMTVGYRRQDERDRLPDQDFAKIALNTLGVINKRGGAYRNANGGTTPPISAACPRDAHVMGMPFEAQSFEIHGAILQDRFFTYDAASACVRGAMRDVWPFGAPVETPVAGPPAAYLREWSRHLFWDDGCTVPAPLQRCGTELLHYADRQAVYSDAFAQTYIGAVADADYLRAAGLVHDALYWWRPGEAVAYRRARGVWLPDRITDALEAVTALAFDAYGIRLVGTTDALGHRVGAKIDYQALLPAEMTDENGVVTTYLYDPLAQLVAEAVAGTEDGAPVGNGSLRGYRPVVGGTSAGVLRDPLAYLQGAGAFYFYDFDAWRRTPPSPSATIAVKRRHFVGPGPARDEPDDIAVVVQHFDGSSRRLATATLVDPGAADAGWLVEDQVRYNDRGDAIRRYRPFFAGTPAFEFGAIAPGWTFAYDGTGRPVGSSSPRGFLTRTAYGAWSTTHWDEDDLVTRSTFYRDNIDNPDCPAAERDALRMAARFEDTWTAVAFDVLGRAIQTVRKLVVDQAPPEVLRSYAWLDARGRTYAFTNPRFYNAAAPRAPACYDFSIVYDMLGQVTRSASADAGDLPIHALDGGRHETLVYDATGSLVLRLDQRGFTHAFRHDPLRQPTETWVSGPGIDGALVEVVRYGVDPETNSVNRPVAQFDQAGVERVESYSILGAPDRRSRQFRRAADGLPDWSGEEALLPAIWSSRQTYDALGQPRTYTAPDGARVMQEHTANGWPKAVRLAPPGAADAVSICAVTDFSPDGLTRGLLLGNGVAETRTYDRDTGRLERIAASDAAGTVVQDLRFTYDPVGNVTQEVDAVAWPPDADGAPSAGDYRYDSLYRLRSATRRRARPAGAAGSEPYARRYTFDHGDNLTTVEDDAGPELSTRFAVARTSDHAVTVAMESRKPLAEWYDAAGSMLGLPNGTGLAHDALGRLVTATGPEGTVGRFQYASDGVRRRKLVSPPQAAGAEAAETFYVGPFIATLPPGSPGAPATADASLQIALGARGLAVASTAGRQTAVTYQLEDQIESVRVVLDGQGAILRREEFYPFGGSALRHDAADTAQDRFRFGGKELDPDTALYDFPMRYYSPDMARWTSPDPAGLIDGPNLFAYVGGNPLSRIDPDGTSWRYWYQMLGARYRATSRFLNPFEMLHRYTGYYIAPEMRRGIRGGLFYIGLASIATGTGLAALYGGKLLVPVLARQIGTAGRLVYEAWREITSPTAIARYVARDTSIVPYVARNTDIVPHAARNTDIVRYAARNTALFLRRVPRNAPRLVRLAIAPISDLLRK